MGRAALLVLVILACAPAARADVIRLEGHNVDAGPVLAGDQLVWADGDGRTWVVFATSAAGTRELARLPSPRGYDVTLHLAADGPQVAAEVRVAYCRDNIDCKYGWSWPAPVATYAGTLDTGLTRAGGCGLSRRCLECSAGPQTIPSVSVSRGALAVLDTCARTVTVTEPDGTRRTFPRRFDVRLGADTLLATLDTDPVRTSLVERSSGRELLRFSGYPWALDPAGEVAWIEREAGGSDRLRAASAPDWSVRDLGATDGDVLLGAGLHRVAVLRWYGPGPNVTVLRGDGSVLTRGRVDRSGLEPAGFDGRRLAWAAQPCSVTSLVSWDVDATVAPPAVPSACDPAVPAGGRVRLNGKRGLPLRLHCPADSEAGCAGTVALRRGRRDGSLLTAVPYLVRPGEARRVRLRVRPGILRRLRRGPVRVTAVALADRGRRAAAIVLRR